MATKKTKTPLAVETLKHDEATRKNIPTAEYQSVMAQDDQRPVRVEYERRNRDLDPQLVWRGKDEQDWSNLIVHAPPLYIQEKVHPKVLVDELKRESERQREAKERGAGVIKDQVDLFADFNGLPDDNAKTEFYQHDAHWANRMILGDSLAVMASLAEREGLRGKVQCIYFDPPYGIKFNSNFQWSTTSRDVKDGNADHITREPEQVKAFRDTWRDGIHSYLTYLRDRLTVARDLLTDSGCLFVQIGDENLHVVRGLLDEVLGASNFVSMVTFAKTSSATSDYLAGVTDYVLIYAKNYDDMKYRNLFHEKTMGSEGTTQYRQLFNLKTGESKRIPEGELDSVVKDGFAIFAPDNLTSQRPPGSFPVPFEGATFLPGKGFWKTHPEGFSRLTKARRLHPIGRSLMYRRFLKDFPVYPISNIWRDVLLIRPLNSLTRHT